MHLENLGSIRNYAWSGGTLWKAYSIMGKGGKNWSFWCDFIFTSKRSRIARDCPKMEDKGVTKQSAKYNVRKAQCSTVVLTGYVISHTLMNTAHFKYVLLLSASSIKWWPKLTFLDSVSISSSTSLVKTSSGKVFSFVERNLIARSLTMSSPWRIWLNKPPKVPAEQNSLCAASQFYYCNKVFKFNSVTVLLLRWVINKHPEYY